MSVCIDFGVTILRLASQGEAVDVYQEVWDFLRQERIAEDMSGFSMREENSKWVMEVETARPLAVMYAGVWIEQFEAEFKQRVAGVAPHALVLFGWEFPEDDHDDED